MKRSTRTIRAASIAAVLAASLTAPTDARSADGAPVALYQRFEVDRTGEWTTVSLRLDLQAWRAGSPDGPVATPKQWLAALRAMRSMVIGAECTPVVHGPTTYPCSFSVAKAVIDDDAAEDVSTQGWRSTSTSALHSGDLQMVSAIMTPQTPPAPAALNVGRQFVGLIAPTALRDKVAAANSRVLRVQIRSGSTPAADADAKVSNGVLILTGDAVDPPAPTSPAATGQDVALRLGQGKRNGAAAVHPPASNQPRSPSGRSTL